MNLKEVQKTLMEYYSRPLLNGKVRHIVFWYDEACEFQEEISNLELENIIKWEVTKENLFATKYEIEKVHPSSHFLLYAPMAKPSPREDWLLDLYKFSFEFATDKVTVIMRDLGVEDDDLLRTTFKKYTKFFNSKERYNLFTSYKIEKYSEQIVDLAVLSAICKSSYVSLEEVLKTLFIEECNETNKYWDNILKFGDEETFWALVERMFGYQQSEKTLFNLFTFLSITHVSEGLRVEVPATWQPYVARQITNSVVFIDHFKANRDEFQQLSDKVVLKIDVEKYCTGWEIENYLDCDTFRQFDVQIIEKLAKLVADGIEDFQLFKGIVNQRRKSHWYSIYKYEMGALYWAISLLEKVKDISQNIIYEDAEVMFNTYITEYSKIDQAYRKFYVELDQVKNVEKLYGLRDYIENVYTNWYLNDLSIQWSKAIENNPSNQWPLMNIAQQNQFYRDNIRSHVNKNERVFVIISDALRYEAGKELADLLNVDRRGSTEIFGMQSVLPSYTDLGMAALLPHKELSIKDGQVIIDGYRASSTENRDVVLNNYVGEAVAITYKNMIGWTRQQYRESLTGKKVVYIFHNSIDSMGESANSEHKVFAAVEDTLSELLSLVNNLVNNISASMIYITADHGFLYQRSLLEKHDKVISTSQDAILFNRRFIVTNKKDETLGTLTFPMSSIQSDQGELFVTIPRGAERFVKQGGGSNYVHGGAMLQEIVVPLIKFKNDRSNNSQNVIKKVDVQLTSITRKITNNITYLEFFQSEKVEEKKVPLRLKVYITDEAGNRVSNENIIIADKRSERPEDRTFREKFVLKSTTYDKTKRYFLVLEDEEETVENIYEQYPFTIDISFGNDFGF